MHRKLLSSLFLSIALAGGPALAEVGIGATGINTSVPSSGIGYSFRGVGVGGINNASVPVFRGVGATGINNAPGTYNTVRGAQPGARAPSNAAPSRSYGTGGIETGTYVTIRNVGQGGMNNQGVTFTFSGVDSRGINTSPPTTSH